jgi:rRNA-processing protein FCF1
MSKSSESQKSVTAFLDTMIFLHFKLFDEVDWRTVLQADNITIIILPVIVGELDKQKDTHTNQKIRKRAKSVSKKFHNLFENSLEAELRDGVVIKYEDVEPDVNFKSNNLNPDRQDDNQLASIIHYKDSHPEERIVLITEDLNLKTKARVRGVETMNMPDELEYHDEPDPNEKLIKELRQQVLELQNQFPIIKLYFNDYSDRITFTLTSPIQDSSAEIERRMNEIMAEHPLIDIPSDNSSESLSSNKNDVGFYIEDLVDIDDFAIDMEAEWEPSIAEKLHYNETLEKFHEKYRTYLPKYFKHLEIEGRTIELKIIIYNEGTSPAEDVYVAFLFPDDLEVSTKTPKSPKLPKPPSKPEPPEPPRSIQDMIRDFRSPSLRAPYIPSLSSSSSHYEPPNMSHLEIEKRNGYQGSFTVRKLKHGFYLSIDSLFITFKSFASAKSFNIRYKIHAANLPRETSGFLNVVIESEDNKSK